MRIRYIGLLLAFVMVAAACTSSTDSTETADGAAPAAGDTTDSSSASPGGSSVDGASGEEIPPLPLLNAEGIAEPGSTIEVTADPRLAGQIALVGSGGLSATASLSSGSALLSIPSGLPTGRYTISLNDGEALGVVTVASSPGVAVFGSSYTVPGAAGVVTLLVHGVGDGDVVALELTDPDGASERMVPHPILGLAPLPLTGPYPKGFTDGLHRVELPLGFTGSVRLVAGDPTVIGEPYSDVPPAISSDQLRIRQCETPSGVTGGLGGEAVVTVQGTGSDFAHQVVTENGRFRFELNPGPAIVSAILKDATTPASSPQVIQVGCGSFVDVGDLTVPVASGPTQGDYLGGLSGDDLWAFSMQASGDLEFFHEGYAECSSWDGDTTINLGSEDSGTLFYTLTLAQPLDTGVKEGLFEIQDVLSGDISSGTLFGEIEVGVIDEVHAMGGAFSGTAEGTLGTIHVELRFTCAGWFLEAAPSVAPPGGVLLSIPVPRGDTNHRLRSGSSNGTQCKRLLASPLPGSAYGELSNLLGAYWAAHLGSALPRLGTSSQWHVREVLQEAERRLKEDPEDTSAHELLVAAAGQVDVDFLLTIQIRELGTRKWATFRLIDLETFRVMLDRTFEGTTVGEVLEAAREGWTSVVEPLTNAGICADLTPATATLDVTEQQDYSLEVANLADESPKSPRVTKSTSTCGGWEPSTGDIENDRWETTFTAGNEECTETAYITVAADGTDREVTGTATTKIVVTDLWKFEVTLEMDGREGHVTSTSTGEFFVDDEFNVLIGGGTGTLEGTVRARCEVNGAVSHQDVDITGAYKVLVSGTATPGASSDPIPITFAPGGFDVHTTSIFKRSSKCIEAGTYQDELLSWMTARMLVLFPHLLASKPDGFPATLLSTGGEYTFEEPLSEIPGGSISARLWRVDKDV